jgi:hypothetical protein
MDNLYKDKSIKDFWDQIAFKDEAYIDLNSLAQGYIFEHKKRYNNKNLKQRPPKEDITFYMPGWVLWHIKAENLVFYNNVLNQ